MTIPLVSRRKELNTINSELKTSHERTVVLHLGIKSFPFDAEFTDPTKSGLRGGGMNKYCSILIEALPSSIDTIVCTSRSPGEPAYEKISNAHVYRFSTFGNRSIRQIIVNLKSFFKAFSLIKRHRVAVLHGHMQIGILAAYLLSRLKNLPVIGTPYSFATNEGSALFNSILSWIEERTYPRVNEIIFESDENRKQAADLRNFILPNSKVLHTGIEVPPAPFIKNPKPLSKLTFYFLGRLVKIKALDRLIEGVSLLTPSQQERLSLDIIGEGETKDELMRLTQTLGVSHLVKLHGFVSDSLPFLKESDVFILPSHQEGLSLSLLEAMSFGKACIVNSFGVPFSSSEVFEMDNNEPASIASALAHFLDDPTQVSRLGTAARRRIEQDFSVGAFAAKYEATYVSAATSGRIAATAPNQL